MEIGGNTQTVHDTVHRDNFVNLQKPHRVFMSLLKIAMSEILLGLPEVYEQKEEFFHTGLKKQRVIKQWFFSVFKYKTHTIRIITTIIIWNLPLCASYSV